MRKSIVLAGVVAFGFVGVLWACDKEARVVSASGDKPCGKAKLQGAVADVMNTLPAMSYRVGDTKTNCYQTATAKAGSGSKIQFVVDKRSYDSETEAVTALAGALESRAQEMKSLQFAVDGKSYHCPRSAKSACKNGQKVKYRVAGFDFDSQEKAEKALQLISTAWNPDASVVEAKPGCDKPCGSATVAAKSNAKPGCDKPCGSATIAAKSNAKPGCDKPCGSATIAAKSNAKPGCDKPCGSATVAAKSNAKPGCDKPCGSATVAAKSNAKPGCDKPCGSATIAAKSNAKPGCDKPCGSATIAAKSNAKPGCDKPCGSATVAAKAQIAKTGNCCKKAQARLAAVQNQLRTMVETAAQVALSS